MKRQIAGNSAAVLLEQREDLYAQLGATAQLHPARLRPGRHSSAATKAITSRCASSHALHGLELATKSRARRTDRQ